MPPGLLAADPLAPGPLAPESCRALISCSGLPNNCGVDDWGLGILISHPRRRQTEDAGGLRGRDPWVRDHPGLPE